MAHGFGAKLRFLRQRHQLTQVALAAALEITQSHLSYLESEENAPALPVVLRAAAHFAVTVDYLLQPDVPTAPPIVASPARQIPDDIRPALAAHLRAAREAHGFSQSALAAQVQTISQVFISHIERGEKLPTPATLRQIALPLGLTTDALLGLDG